MMLFARNWIDSKKQDRSEKPPHWKSPGMQRPTLGIIAYFYSQNSFLNGCLSLINNVISPVILVRL